MENESDEEVKMQKFLSFSKLPVLEEQNKHERDANISFKEEGHIYTIKGWDTSGFLSVTSWCGSQFPPITIDEMASKKLDSMSAELTIKLMIKNEGRLKVEEMMAKELGEKGKQARIKGTRFHLIVECILNDPVLPHGYCNGHVYESLFETLLSSDNNFGDLAVRESEVHYFTKFLRKFHYLIPYRTEWRMYHEDYKITGTADAVFTDKDGKFYLFDWKRTRNFTESKNFGNNVKNPDLHDYFRDNTYSKYTMQLNIYRIMLKDKYGIDIEGMYILRFHPDEKDYELVPIQCYEDPIRKALEIRKLQ